MGKKKSSFHMGDEFNGNGQKVYLRPTKHNTYEPLSQQNVRLTPNFSQYVPKAIGAIPVGCKSTHSDNKVALKAIGGIPSMSQVIVKKDKKKGIYKGEFRVRKKQLTTGGSLQEKNSAPRGKIKTPEVLRGKAIKIAPWLTAYMKEPIHDEVVAVLGTEELHFEDRELFRMNHPEADWYAYEDYIEKNEDGTPYYTINSYAATQLREHYSEPEFYYSDENGFTNAEGRYWVAVGPEVLCPGYNDRPEEEQTLTEDQFKYGTKIDVIMQHMIYESKLIYIECIVGDVMGHSYPNGVFQTGDPYPNSSNGDEYGGYAINGAYVEFINAPAVIEGGKKIYTNFYEDERMSDYRVVEVVVYSRDW